ncbi:hypothetical protein BMS3Bbin04_01154 [bacterium BMS3Bbin04]|nr:hypothetical protein BMS3Bbin04_01154 [bacterium BMS3Bbin04]
MIDERRIIFILGTPRSGTSWASSTFELLPKSCVLFEPDVPRRYESPWRDQVTPYWSADQYVIRANSATEASRELAKPVIQHLEYVIQSEAKSEDEVVVIKIPRLEKMPYLLDHFQPSHVFFMLRNPYAILNSYERYGLLKRLRPTIEYEFNQLKSGAPEFGIEYDFDRARTIEQKHALLTAVRHQLAPILLESYPHSFVNYEEMCFNPADRYRDMFEQANLVWSEEIGRVITEKSQATEEGASFHSVVKRSETRAHGWRQKLSPAIVDSVREMFAELGIEDSTPPLTEEERKIAVDYHAGRTRKLKRDNVLNKLHHLKLKLMGKDART